MADVYAWISQKQLELQKSIELISCLLHDALFPLKFNTLDCSLNKVRTVIFFQGEWLVLQVKLVI